MIQTSSAHHHARPGALQDVKMVAWHPSGLVLASASYDNTIKLWVNDGDEWSCSQTLGGEHG
jgi:WD40 repeat protein